MKWLFFDSCIVVVGSVCAGNFYELTNVASKKGKYKVKKKRKEENPPFRNVCLKQVPPVIINYA